ncbi:MAG: nickel pincer cofactor biosynthesis protein LarC [Anaerovoracaceae bacterium]|jgi:uncharacterized protein (TIGR00299 family) protein
MKLLYFDLGMGAAGDMLSSALLELLPEEEQDKMMLTLNGLGIPGVKFRKTSQVKCGITGTRIVVTVNGVEEQPNEPLEQHDDHDHTHDHPQDHHHIHAHENEIEHDHGHEHMHAADHEHIHAPEHTHTHDSDHAHEHTHTHDHAHYGMNDIRRIVSQLAVSPSVRDHILAVYQNIAEAESRVHDAPVDQIHFHEVGSLDAVADITAFCVLLERIAPEKVIASPIHTGCGSVRCAHGILPVPTPATVEILKGIPVYSTGIEGELCTPTGAALMKHFVSEFRSMPLMTPDAVGYGMGTKDFEQANAVRAILGESTSPNDGIVKLECNVDDMTGEEIGFATERLFDCGAVEVYTTSCMMKKGRPGTLITCLCHQDRREELIRAIFRLTSTIGIREQTMDRSVLTREIRSMKTEAGMIREKVSTGFGVTQTKLEYDDVAAFAKDQGISYHDAVQRLRKK